MVASKYVIGVDIGTTSTKAVLFDTDGLLISTHSIEYLLYPDSALLADNMMNILQKMKLSVV